MPRYNNTAVPIACRDRQMTAMCSSVRVPDGTRSAIPTRTSNRNNDRRMPSQTNAAAKARKHVNQHHEPPSGGHRTTNSAPDRRESAARRTRDECRFVLRMTSGDSEISFSFFIVPSEIVYDGWSYFRLTDTKKLVADIGDKSPLVGCSARACAKLLVACLSAA